AAIALHGYLLGAAAADHGVARRDGRRWPAPARAGSPRRAGGLRAAVRPDRRSAEATHGARLSARAHDATSLSASRGVPSGLASGRGGETCEIGVELALLSEIEQSDRCWCSPRERRPRRQANQLTALDRDAPPGGRFHDAVVDDGDRRDTMI